MFLMATTESTTAMAPEAQYLRLSVRLQLTVTPAESADYQLTPLSGDQYTSCLCGNERKTLSWAMFPTALGERQAFAGLQWAQTLTRVVSNGRQGCWRCLLQPRPWRHRSPATTRSCWCLTEDASTESCGLSS